MEGQISILEKDFNTKPGKFPGHEERVKRLGIPVDPNQLKRSEYNDLFAEARKNILSEDFVIKLVSAMTEKSLSHTSVRKLAKIENALVEICVNLTDTDIDNLVGQLNRKSVQYISENKYSLNLSGKTLDDIHSGRWNPYSVGIKNVVHFIRERTKLLISKPTQKFVLGFNDHLDVDRKADLIEIIFGEEEPVIDQLNFIQIKSSTPTKEEVSDIVREHRNFAGHDILSLKEIEVSGLSTEKIGINSVNSIVAIGPKIINQTEVYNSKQSVKGALAATN